MRISPGKIGLVVTALALLLPASGSAATTFGSDLTAVPTANLNCVVAGGCTQVATSITPADLAPGGLVAPISGVVVRWRAVVGTNASTLTPRIIRPTTGTLRTGAGTGDTVTPPINATSTFDTRLPIHAGDYFGVNSPGSTVLAFAAGSDVGYWGSPMLADGATPSTPAAFLGYQLLANADIEADSDGDGYGDETQDGCPTDPAFHGACPDRTAPETTITKAPKRKSSKGRVKIVFSSSEIGSTFICQLDSGPFEPCTSPATFHVSKGKHSLQVVATDAAGNIDATPATAKFKRKRKR